MTTPLKTLLSQTDDPKLKDLLKQAAELGGTLEREKLETAHQKVLAEVNQQHERVLQQRNSEIGTVRDQNAQLEQVRAAQTHQLQQQHEQIRVLQHAVAERDQVIGNLRQKLQKSDGWATLGKVGLAALVVGGAAKLR